MPVVNPGDTLQAQWYNTLTASLGLSPQRFQLLQPSAPLGTTSDALWAYFNDLPPDTISSAVQSGGDQFYSTYEAVVNQLLSQGGNRVRAALGDSYAPWETFIKANPLAAGQTIVSVFRTWAMTNAPDKTGPGSVALLSVQNDPIFLAQTAVTNTSGFINNTPNFSRTIDDLTAALQSAPSVSISFDSSTASSDISSTWSAHSSGIFFGAYSGDSSESTFSLKASSARFTVSGTYKSVLTFQADPGSWYSSAALGNAYSQPDNTLWSHGTPSWLTTFGPNGNMLHFTGSIVVVDGVDLTITSYASYNSDEQDHYRSHSSGGFWPFYSTSSTYTRDSDVSFASNGSLTVRVSSPAGNPLVLGVNAVPARQYLLGQAAGANVVSAAATPARRAA
ncbi:MAG TPA: hypothetical protein VF618_19110 [Thermoanaerobaculia bacterium]